METDKEKEKKGKTSKSRRETAVQGTNDSSIVSKCSMATQGYFEDKFLQHFVSKVTRRAPLIHRGYYVRAKALEHILKKFLADNDGLKQIVSLGAGFDSSYFRLKSQGLLLDTVFYEVDFPEVVRRKAGLIQASSELLPLLGPQSQPATHTWSQVVMSTDQYKLLGVDLSQTTTLEAVLRVCHINFDLPTLFLSECVLTYMTPRGASSLVRWAAETFTNSVFVLYEQIHPDDAFGLVMQNHFQVVGSPLRSITAFPNIEAQKQRFLNLGWSHVEALDMNQFYYCLLAQGERDRLERLEPFDEHEQWHMKCAHYMVLCAYQGSCGPTLAGIPDTDIQGYEKAPQGEGQITVVRDHSWGTLKRFGHASCCLGYSSTVLCVGGFGEQEGKHKRISQLSLVNTISMDTVDVSPGVGSLTLEVSRMHPAIVGLKDGRVLLIGGRLSPLKLCRQLVALTFSPGLSAWDKFNPCSNRSTNFGHKPGFYDKSCEHEKENCRKNINKERCEKGNSFSNNNKETKEVMSDNALLTKPGGASDLTTQVGIKANNKAGGTNLKVCDNGSKCDEDSNCSDVIADDVETSSEHPVIVEGLDQSGATPCPRWRHSAVVFHSTPEEESIIVFGGRTQSCMALGDCFQLNPQLLHWTQVPSTSDGPGPRQSHTASLWDRHMVVAGGLDDKLRPLDTVCLLNFDTLQWHQLPGRIQPRYSHTAHICGDILVLIGGVNFAAHPPGVGLVHLPSGQVRELDLPVPDTGDIVMYHGHTSVALGNHRILLLGGGGNCFSFGTHLNSSPYVIDISDAIKHFETDEDSMSRI